MKLNSLIIGDTLYEMSKAYRAGAQAMRDSISCRCNPYRDTFGQNHHDWDAGHNNEAGCEHIRFGQDLITAKKNGRVFTEDASVPRDEYGVNRNWYLAQRKTLQSKTAGV